MSGHSTFYILRLTLGTSLTHLLCLCITDLGWWPTWQKRTHSQPASTYVLDWQKIRPSPKNSPDHGRRTWVRQHTYHRRKFKASITCLGRLIKSSTFSTPEIRQEKMKIATDLLLKGYVFVPHFVLFCHHSSWCCSFCHQRKYNKKAWGSVSAEDKSQCELALLKYLNKKLDHAAHRNTFDRKFLDYRGDVLGVTLHDMVEKGILVEVTDRRYKLC